MMISESEIKILVSNYLKYKILSLDGVNHIELPKDKVLKNLSMKVKMFYSDLEPDDILAIINKSIYKGFIVLPFIIFPINRLKDKTDKDIALKIIMTCYMLGVNLIKLNKFFIVNSDNDYEIISNFLYDDYNKHIELSILAPGLGKLTKLYEVIEHFRIKEINWYSGVYNMKYTTYDDYQILKKMSDRCVINEINTTQFCKFNETKLKNINYNFFKKLKITILADTFPLLNYWYKRFYSDEINFQGIFKKLKKSSTIYTHQIYNDICDLVQPESEMTQYNLYSEYNNIMENIDKNSSENILISLFNNLTNGNSDLFSEYVDILYKYVDYKYVDDKNNEKSIFDFKREIIKAIKHNEISGPICDQLINILNDDNICFKIDKRLNKNNNNDYYSYQPYSKDDDIVSQINIRGHIINDEVLNEIVNISDRLDKNPNEILINHGLLFDTLYDNLYYYSNYKTEDDVFACINKHVCCV